MRSVERTRDQLLDIAVGMFADKGFNSTSLRAIAKQAGVSPALMIHHFGSKDELIKEAISKTIGRWVAEEKAVLLVDEQNQVESWQAIMSKGSTPLAFFRQVLLAGGDYSRRLFDAAVEESVELLEMMSRAGRLKGVSDSETTALLLAISGLGSVLMMDHIERRLGGPISSTEVATKLMNANNEMLQGGVFEPSGAENKVESR